MFRKVMLQNLLRQATDSARLGQRGRAVACVGEALTLAKSELNGMIQAGAYTDAMQLVKGLNNEIKNIRFSLLQEDEKREYLAKTQASNSGMSMQQWGSKKRQIIDTLFDLMKSEGHLNHAQLATRLELVQEPAEAKELLMRAGLSNLME